MNVEIINTGTELLLGRTLNTHQQWLSRELSRWGYPISRQMTVPDSGAVISQAIQEALVRADLIITTGGLGPTSDDLTCDCIARLLGRKLIEDPNVLAMIRQYFTERGRPYLPAVGRQALVPEGATILPNAHGTAPGLYLELDPNPFRQPPRRSGLILLPGPPRELHPMFREQVLPRLLSRFPLEQPQAAITLKTTGWGESLIEEKITPPLASLIQQGLQASYCARVGEVEVRLSAQGAIAATLVQQAETIVRQQLAPIIFGQEQDLLEAVIVNLLSTQHQSLAVAESCTGGLLAHRLTNVAGASAVFLAGWITYHNDAKAKFLGVPPEIINRHGSVSESTARAMAEGARRLAGADYALAVTGIAGPSGGTPDKPVGTVYLALATPDRTMVEHKVNRMDRESFKQATTQQALEMLRQVLKAANSLSRAAQEAKNRG